MIPALDDHGLLPPGVHACTLAEVTDTFGYNEHRRALLDGLRRFIDEQMLTAGLRCPLLIDGGFVRARAAPKDIDVVLDLFGLEDAPALAVALSLRHRHDELLRAYHVDAWARHPRLPVDLGAYFQYAGTTAAAELRIDSKHPKGILRIQT